MLMPGILHYGDGQYIFDRAVWKWTRLLRVVVDSPSPEIFKHWLRRHLQEVGLDDLMKFQFYDAMVLHLLPHPMNKSPSLIIV